MPITTTTRKTSHYGNGSNKTFTFDFPADADGDIYVILVAADGGETDITDFTVSRSESGGSITLGSGVSAPLGTEQIVIYRYTSLTQPYDFIVAGSINADQIEDAINKLTMGIQEVKETDARQLTLSIASPAGVSAVLPNAEADTWLAWNSAATAIVNKEDPNVTTLANRLAAEAAAANSLTYSNNSANSANASAASASDASGYATTALGHSNTALGHANDAAAHSATASGYLDDCVAQVVLATTYADLSQDWAESDDAVEPGKYSAKYWADRAYSITYSGVQPFFPVGTKQWFYQASPPDGWQIISGLEDKLIAVGGYATVSGGNTGGSWTYSDFTLTASGAHTHSVSHIHTMNSHTHTGPSHTHAGVDHLHTTPSHTHAGVDHLHAGAYHRHYAGDHYHSLGSHTHSVTSYTTSVAAAAPEASYTTVVYAVATPTGAAAGTTGYNTGAYTDYQQGSTGAADRSLTTGGAAPTTNGADRSLTTGAAGTGATGGPNTNDTSTENPTSSSNGSHTHPFSHGGTDRPAACVGIIAEYIGTGT